MPSDDLPEKSPLYALEKINSLAEAAAYLIISQDADERSVAYGIIDGIACISHKILAEHNIRIPDNKHENFIGFD